jgi:tight adherence protein C
MTRLVVPWFGLALAGGIAVVLGLLLVLYRDLRRTERLSRRLRMVQPGAAVHENRIEAELAAPLRIVTAIGEAIARSGAMSTKTLEELRQTLHVAGFRGRHGLGLFVGTKLLLVVGLPLATLTLPWLMHRELPYPAALLAIATGIGLLAPDKVVQRLRKRYLRALELPKS